MANIEIKFRQAKEFILDLIFPRECIGCGREGSYFCNQCRLRLEVTGKFHCAFCHQPSDGGQICDKCRPETDLKAVWVATDYNNKLIQDLLHNLKYNYLEEIAGDLAAILAGFLQVNNIFDKFFITANNCILVPVPLHQKRILGRGFNQSELLADRLKQLLGLKKVNNLKRIINTQTQINLNRKERQHNVKNVFISKGPFETNKKVILIDDVLTTGSTLKECAKVLNQAGYKDIYGLVVAQGDD